MLGFEELTKSWTKLAEKLGGQCAEEPLTVPGSYLSERYAPTVLRFKYKRWNVKFTAAPATPRLLFVEPTFSVIATAPFSAKRTFDVAISSSEVHDQIAESIQGALHSLISQALAADDRLTNKQKTARANVSEIDLHYTIRSLGAEDAALLFSEPKVREAVLAAPKLNLRIYGYPASEQTLPGAELERIAVTETLRPSDTERIEQILRAFQTILDRLAELDYIFGP